MKNKTYVILLALAVLLICSKTQETEVKDDPPIPTYTQIEYICPFPTQAAITPPQCIQIEYARETSRQGKEFIAFWEGFKNSMYEDMLGHCTVGFGHKFHDGPCEGWEWPSWVTKDQGWVLLENDVSIGDFFIYQQGWSLNQQQWDAISSIIFNMGTGNFEKSRIYKAIDEARWEDVPNAIRAATCCASVLVKRRADEARIWEEGVYSYSIN